MSPNVPWLPARRGDPTFAAAALTYMQAGSAGSSGSCLIASVIAFASMSQADIDAAVFALYPDAGAAARNRQVYSTMSAIMKRAGLAGALRRPAGARGRRPPLDLSSVFGGSRTKVKRNGTFSFVMRQTKATL
jgi:hypothetical protein